MNPNERRIAANIDRARRCAHLFIAKCSGDTGYGPGGDGKRYHSRRCNDLTDAIAHLLNEKDSEIQEFATPHPTPDKG